MPLPVSVASAVAPALATFAARFDGAAATAPSAAFTPKLSVSAPL